MHSKISAINLHTRIIVRIKDVVDRYSGTLFCASFERGIVGPTGWGVGTTGSEKKKEQNWFAHEFGVLRQNASSFFIYSYWIWFLNYSVSKALIRIIYLFFYRPIGLDLAMWMGLSYACRRYSTISTRRGAQLSLLSNDSINWPTRHRLLRRNYTRLLHVAYDLRALYVLSGALLIVKNVVDRFVTCTITRI